MDVAVSALVEFAPAKINLALHVTGRRADGFHLLESLVVFAATGDRVRVEATAEDRFSVAGPFAEGVPTDGGNLVVRARDLLRSHSVQAFPVSIRLEKNLPVASGIGGGSSDAAATLRALNDLWKPGLSLAGLADIGRELGADVPMCLHAGPLIARGIGEEIKALDGFPSLHMVLVNPGVPVSTPAIFGALASRKNPPLPPLASRRDFHALAGWLAATRNDLEAPAIAIAPPIADALAALRGTGAAIARMSGSGATCFGLYPTPQAAETAANFIRRAEPHWFIAATQSMDRP